MRGVEAYLETWSMGDGITNNDSVLTANISSVTLLYVSNYQISDLTGIEDFAALTTLDCSFNQLTSLDVSGATALEILGCNYNQLTSLDLSNNTALYILSCGDNNLTSLDLSNNTALTDLRCSYNQLISLNVTNNTALTYLDCGGNQLTSLDVSNNTALAGLGCDTNQLNCLNIKNTVLLDSATSSPFWGLYVSGNPNLTCVEVDDAADATIMWTVTNGAIDSQTSFSENCNYPASCWIVGIEEEPPTKPKELLTITDILGRTTLPIPNTLLFYIYDDGSVEKKIQLER